MRSTNYSKFCLQLFGKYFRKHKKDELIERNTLLERANIQMEYAEYHAMVIMNMLLGLIITLILSLTLSAIIQSTYGLLLIILLPTLFVALIGAAYLYLPTYLIQKRGENIDRFLPYAINFIGSMAVAGVSPTEIFQTLSTIKVYGEIQTEAKRIAKEINVMGIDNITALKHAIELSPSKNFKSFLQGIIGTIQSGSDLHSYLSNIVGKYLEEDLIERKKNLDLLAVVAETFVISVIAFPIFLVIILSVMGFFGGSMETSISIMFLFSFLVLPVIYVAFYLFVETASAEKISRYVTDKGFEAKTFFTEYKTSLIVLLASILIFVIFGCIVLLLSFYNYLEPSLYLLIDVAFIGVVIIIGPIGFYQSFRNKTKIEIQERFPDFLVEVGDSLSSGMNAFEAIKAAEKGRYGKLSPEIKMMKTQLSWNIPIKEVFIDFANRMKSGIIQRIVVTINEGLIMGGNTSKIFKAAATEVNQVNQIEHQRKANMSVYMSVIVMCFFVFLAIILILDKTIFTSFFDIQAVQVAQTGPQMVNMLSISVVEPLLLKYALFSFVFVQSIGSGILAGVMVDGKLSSGVRFACVLGLVTFIVFKLLV